MFAPSVLQLLLLLPLLTATALNLQGRPVETKATDDSAPIFHIGPAGEAKVPHPIAIGHHWVTYRVCAAGGGMAIRCKALAALFI